MNCRLLQHNADMACGMDFDRPKIDSLPHQVNLFSLHESGGMSNAVTCSLCYSS